RPLAETLPATDRLPVLVTVIWPPFCPLAAILPGTEIFAPARSMRPPCPTWPLAETLPATDRLPVLVTAIWPPFCPLAAILPGTGYSPAAMGGGSARPPPSRLGRQGPRRH